MTLDALLKLLVPGMLVTMMVAIGLQVTVAEVKAVAQDRRLIGKAMLANYVLVPVATVALLILFHPVNPTVPVGFLILAVCPGAPFGPPFTRLARGDAAVSVVLMLLLAGTSAVAAPVLLHLLLPLLTSASALQVDAPKIVATLLVTQLVPLCLGFGLRHWRPGLAARVQKPAQGAGSLLSVLTIGLMLYSKWDLLTPIRLRGYTGMLMLLTASLGIGWLLGGPRRENRKAMTLTTSLRNLGVALVIVTSNFAGTAAVTAVLAYGFVEILGSAVVARFLGRRPTTAG